MVEQSLSKWYKASQRSTLFWEEESTCCLYHQHVMLAPPDENASIEVQIAKTLVNQRDLR